MRWVLRAVLGIGALGLGLGACESTETANTEPLSWQGAEPHFIARGILNGEHIDIRIEGADAEDGANVWCEREYDVPLVDGVVDLTQARQVETSITGYATVDGEERIFQLEIKQHGLQDDQPGDRVTIIPRVDEVPPSEDEAWFDWEWQTIDEEDLFESSAQEGEIALEAFTGEPGEGGVIIPEGEGIVGAAVQARWSVDESLSLSFSVPCTANDIEEY
jgi:hypothetical protein